MEEDKLAKNILTNRTCYRCIYYVWEQGDVEFCERGVNRNNQYDPSDPYAGTKAIPPILTCEHWSGYTKHNTLATANKENTMKLIKLYGYKDD